MQNKTKRQQKEALMNLFHIFTQGVLFGLTLSLMIGPAFFSLLQTSISKGFRSGAHFALGISLSDVIMVFVAWYGMSTFFETPQARQILSVIGGAVIVGFGIYTATRKHRTPKQRYIKSSDKFQFKYLGKGFLFNIANIGTWLYWLIPVSIANSYTTQKEQFTFLVSILLTNLGMDMLKCKVSHELKRFLTDNVITLINRIVGVIIIIFGIYLAISTFLSGKADIIGNNIL